MKLNEYQNKARETAIYPRGSEGSVSMYPYLALAEESGEVCGKVAKHVRDGTELSALKAQVKAELGDVLWQLSNAAADMGLTLEEIADYNLQKLASRKERGVLQGSGDNR